MSHARWAGAGGAATALGALAALAGTMALGGAAWAQTFPAAADGWTPLRCGAGPMTDWFQDEAGAISERDLVGDDVGPAGFGAFDASFVYLSLRLDEDPAPGGTLRPFGWGVELDLDGDLTTYEILITIDGVTEQIVLRTNNTTTLPDDPADAADDPPVATYPFATHGRSAVAVGTAWGGTIDYLLDFAVPWADLEPLGFFVDSTVVIWAGSSSVADRLDGDLACHDGGGGDPTLSEAAGGPIVIDPAADTDGDGYADTVETSAGTDPNDPTSFPDDGPGGIILEGGGGCAVVRHSGGSRPGAAAPFAFAALLLVCAAGRHVWRRHTARV